MTFRLSADPATAAVTLEKMTSALSVNRPLFFR